MQTATAVEHVAVDELEIAFLAPPAALRFFWRNAEGERGMFYSRDELGILLARIGGLPAWDWIVVETSAGDGRFAQSCGNARRGLIAEINGPCLVTRIDAAAEPQVNVGTRTWPYMAAAAELLHVREAADLFMEWLTGKVVPTAYELREPDPSVPRSTD